MAPRTQPAASRHNTHIQSLFTWAPPGTPGWLSPVHKLLRIKSKADGPHSESRWLFKEGTRLQPEKEGAGQPRTRGVGYSPGGQGKAWQLLRYRTWKARGHKRGESSAVDICHHVSHLGQALPVTANFCTMTESSSRGAAEQGLCLEFTQGRPQPWGGGPSSADM